MRIGTKGELDVRSFLFVIFVVLLELSFFFEKQFLDPTGVALILAKILPYCLLLYSSRRLSRSLISFPVRK